MSETAANEQGGTIRPGVAGVVFDGKGDVLLHRRRVGKGWAPPSGTMEPGEDLRSALRRELREETALGVTIDRLVGVYSNPQFQVVRYPDGTSVHFVTSLFECHIQSGGLTGSEEGTAWDWFSPEALPEPLLPYAERWLADALSEHSCPVVR